MHSAFDQFAAFNQDAIDNKAFAAKGSSTMPVLALGGDKSFGTQMGDDHASLVASNVTERVIKDSGHWVMEEQPAADDGDDCGVHRQGVIAAKIASGRNRYENLHRLSGRVDAAQGRAHGIARGAQRSVDRRIEIVDQEDGGGDADRADHDR